MNYNLKYQKHDKLFYFLAKSYRVVVWTMLLSFFLILWPNRIGIFSIFWWSVILLSKTLSVEIFILFAFSVVKYLQECFASDTSFLTYSFFSSQPLSSFVSIRLPLLKSWGCVSRVSQAATVSHSYRKFIL